MSLRIYNHYPVVRKNKRAAIDGPEELRLLVGSLGVRSAEAMNSARSVSRG